MSRFKILFSGYKASWCLFCGGLGTTLVCDTVCGDTVVLHNINQVTVSERGAGLLPCRATRPQSNVSLEVTPTTTAAEQKYVNNLTCHSLLLHNHDDILILSRKHTAALSHIPRQPPSRVICFVALNNGLVASDKQQSMDTLFLAVFGVINVNGQKTKIFAFCRTN